MRSTLVLIFFVCLTASPVVSDAGACGDKRLCGDMATCAEAHHYLPACNVQSLDRDNDGVPCETICGKSLSTMQSRLLGPYMSSVQVETQCSGLWIASNSAAATCQQMTSCGEAKFHMTSCGVGWLDGNGDGVACNGGWDAYREKAFARQKELGIVPKEAALSRHDPDVQNWTTLSADERRLYAMMEVFCRIPHPHRPLHRRVDRLPQDDRRIRQHTYHADFRQRRQSRGRVDRLGQREQVSTMCRKT